MPPLKFAVLISIDGALTCNWLQTAVTPTRSFADRHEPVRRVAVQRRQRDVFAHREIHHKARGPSILRDEEQTLTNRRRRVGDLNRRPVQEHSSGERPLDAEDRLRDFRPPGADQTGNAEDFTAADPERDRLLRVAPGAQALDPEALIPAGDAA